MRLPWLENDDVEPLPIYTRSGWEIPQLNPSELEAEQSLLTVDLVRIRTNDLLQIMTAHNKSRARVRSVSAHLYNCVGMIFCNRRTWIDITHIYQLLYHDGYERLESARMADVGDIVVYTRGGMPSHVGSIIRVDAPIGQIMNLHVLSKWGRDGEVAHHLDDVPQALGRPDSFWSEKVR